MQRPEAIELMGNRIASRREEESRHPSPDIRSMIYINILGLTRRSWRLATYIDTVSVPLCLPGSRILELQGWRDPRVSVINRSSTEPFALQTQVRIG